MRSAVGCGMAQPWHATHLRSIRVHRRALLLVSLLVVAAALNLLVFAAYFFILLAWRRPNGLSAPRRRGKDAAARDDGQQCTRTSCSSCAAFCAAAAAFGLRPIVAAGLPSCAVAAAHARRLQARRTARGSRVPRHEPSGEQASPYCASTPGRDRYAARHVVPARNASSTPAPRRISEESTCARTGYCLRAVLAGSLHAFVNMLTRAAARLRRLGAARHCSSQAAWVAAWGNNDQGRLGLDVDATNVRQPQRVRGLPSGVAPLKVAAGGAHTLVLLSSGEVFGWGLNDWAQLGSGDSHVPRLVAALPTDLVRISAGSFHNLAVTQDGCLWAWGRNTEGQLGLGPDAPSLVDRPTLVPLDEPIMDVAAGSRHSLALSHSGQLYAFGARALLGLGGERWRLGTSLEPEPRLVRSLRGVRVRAIATGNLHSAVACEDGHVYTFGEGAFAQLGTGGSDRAAPEPVRVPGLQGVAQLAGGGLHTLALTRGGTLYSWGSNEHGSLGLGDIEGPQQRVPSLLPDVSLAQVSCGWKHNAGVGQAGELFAWGWGGSQGEDTGSSGGQLGLGNEYDYWVPTRVPLDDGVFVQQVACGFNHTAAVFRSR